MRSLSINILWIKKINNHERIDHLQVNNKLNEFKKSIEDVSKKFETSMSSGQKNFRRN